MSTNFTGITFANQNTTPSDDGIIRRAMLGDGILTGCALSYTGSTLTMGPGQLMVCGRQIRHPSVQNWPISDATSGFARVVLTVDLTKTSTKDAFEQVDAAVEYASSEAGFVSLVQNDINASGTMYQVVLAVVSLSTGGISGITYRIPESGSGVGSSKSSIIVHAPTGSAVYIENQAGKRKDTGEKNGVWTFKGCDVGTWTVYASQGANSEETVVVIQEEGQLLRYEVTIAYVKIYGIQRDITQSSPEWVRTDDAVGFTAVASVGTQAGYSDFDSCYPWSGIVRETLYTGDVMVKIPRFWYKRWRDGNVEHIQIADGEKEGFKLHPAFNHAGVPQDTVYLGAYESPSNCKSVSGVSIKNNTAFGTLQTTAKAKGAGWSLWDISSWSAIVMLILVEFATFDVQTAIGMGITGLSNGTFKNSGGADSVPNLTGVPSGTSDEVAVVWRGLENLWGNSGTLLDGAVVPKGGGGVYVSNDPSAYAYNTTTGYTKLPDVQTVIGGGFITELHLIPDFDYIFLAKSAGGSSSTYICDKTSGVQDTSNNANYLQIGGSSHHGNDAGLFYVYCINPAMTSTPKSARIMYIPQEVSA